MFNRNFADPYVIAEIGMNYEGSMDRAKNMISQIAEAGGHAAKFQTYKAEKLASEFDSPSYWDISKEPTSSQFELFKKYDSFGEKEYIELADHCTKEGIDFLSTPFDLEAVDLLENLVPAFKIASADLTNIPLLRKVASTGKPILLSVGASSHDEIDTALSILEKGGASEIVILHCVLEYPTPVEHANLSAIKTLRNIFGSRASIGYSDHVAPTKERETPALDLAVLLGAKVIEKHFSDNTQLEGNDHYHSIDMQELEKFSNRLYGYRKLLGAGEPDLGSQLDAINNARRRIFLSADLPKGSIIQEDHLIALRASEGIPVSLWDEVLGKTLLSNKYEGESLTELDVVI